MKVVVTRTARRVVRLQMENGVLKVVANWLLSEKKLRRIIAENIEWINAHRSDGKTAEQHCDSAPKQSSSVKEPPVSKEGGIIGEIYDGRKTVIFGDLVTVRAGVGAKTYLDEDSLYVSSKCYESRESRLRAIKAYLKKIAATYVSNEIANFGSDISLCPSKIEFRDNGDFWVKCSLAAQRVLCFDFRIVQLPQKLRRYVIAHAFAHFSHPLHDDDFWNFLSNSLPHYRDYAKELESYRVLKDI